MNLEQFNPVRLQEARIYAAQVNYRLAEESLLPSFGFASHVTDAEKAAYSRNQIAVAEDIIAGKCDGNFTVRQRMYYFLTGECVPLLPKEAHK